MPTEANGNPILLGTVVTMKATPKMTHCFTAWRWSLNATSDTMWRLPISTESKVDLFVASLSTCWGPEAWNMWRHTCPATSFDFGNVRICESPTQRELPPLFKLFVLPSKHLTIKDAGCSNPSRNSRLRPLARHAEPLLVPFELIPSLAALGDWKPETSSSPGF